MRFLIINSNLSAIGRLTALNFCAGNSTSINKKIIPVAQDESFVEKDASKLCKFACVNYRLDVDKEGPEIVPDSEYPEWLFKIDLRGDLPIEDLDPEKDGWKYWLAYKKREEEQRKRFEVLKYKYIYMQRSPSIKKVRQYNKFAYA